MKRTAKNPAFTGIYTADPSAHVWEDGRIYIYASHDMDPPRGCDLMDHYHVFSSSNMVDWRDEGEILSSDDVAWGRPEGGFMWAPDAAYKNGKYYFYYPHPSGSDWNHTWKIGVAVSDHPAKDFNDLGIIEGLGGFALIDPCVFVDEDGSAYMYYGGGGKCLGGIMNEDMISMKQECIPMEGLEDFHEAAWIFRRGSLYYLTYSDNLHGKNQLRYATSDKPLGPWTYRGVYLEPTDCDTSHGSVVEYKGQWYQFYHNCSLSGRGNLRTVCIDKLEFDDNGLIKPVQQTTEGVSAVGEKEAPLPSAVIPCDIMLNSTKRAGIADLDGHGGSRVQITLTALEKDHKRVRIFINGEDKSLLNLIDGSGYTTFKLKNSNTNSIEIEAHECELTLKEIKLEYLD
ncbi:MAG: family 43 glycosylhydrolase [Clostridia bacterium]|nr:family 43 glycosylhydrolase [Clostridia bacterium]